MNESARTTIQTTFDASNQGTIHFGQVIGQLMSAGVESHHVDYRAGRTICYLWVFRGIVTAHSGLS